MLFVLISCSSPIPHSHWPSIYYDDIEAILQIRRSFNVIHVLCSAYGLLCWILKHWKLTVHIKISLSCEDVSVPLGTHNSYAHARLSLFFPVLVLLIHCVQQHQLSKVWNISFIACPLPPYKSRHLLVSRKTLRTQSTYDEFIWSLCFCFFLRPDMRVPLHAFIW